MSRAPANSVSKGFNAAGGINLTSKRAFEYFKAMLIISQSLGATIRKRVLQDRRDKFYHKTAGKNN
jgi:hypothetical protein|nr:hypothetical protein [uncultured Campylobacter sp.]